MRNNKARKIKTLGDRYGLFILRNHLHWIKVQNPRIYDFYDKSGKWCFQTGDERDIKEYKNKGYAVKRADNKKLAVELKKDIKSLEAKIKKSKKQ